ncbi:RNase H-like domain found in reverse transcriptase [Popillia japonica]|uniref:RNase H-like domain found in reverse transcriptase n=1 Tax=Popillia japonica TaxID=7064 RepID=A0AAW1ID60_POPJA
MRYSQIEKEMLAAAWAMDHFKLYLPGNTFEPYTDHKPLLHILQNTRKTSSARLERLILKTQRYNFHAIHQKGSQNPADYLSRHPLPEVEKDKTENYLNFVINQNLPKKITEELS